MSGPANPSEPLGTMRQTEIYVTGMRRHTPAIPLGAEELEKRAEAAFSPEALGYISGGAGGDDTVAANRAAIARWRIVPRMLRDVGVRSLKVELFGQLLPAPVLLAPIGVQTLVHPEGELPAARAAASLRIPFIQSSAASRTLEDVAKAMGDAPKWFQLYWSKSPDIARSFLQRAEKSGYQAIVVTLDTMLLGWRERDLQNAYLPFLFAEGIANYLSDPEFRKALAKPPEEDQMAAVMYFLNIFSSAAYTWKDIAFLRAQTKLPILLKGILHPDDASLALDHGVDGIIVSNHGGRQVAGAIGAMDALPKVVDVVGSRVPVLFDSGIRRGADAFKALALGAKAVLLGRPYIHGLALAGEAGVREVVKNFLADLDLTLGTSGHASVAGLSRSDVVREGT